MALAVASAAGNGVVGALASQAVMRILNGNFNPNYSKADRKRMRYLQQKFVAAYGSVNATEDIADVIKNLDPNSKLLMVADGVKPANPFPDERSFEESLILNIQPVSGHEGRFAASHAIASIGVIIEYQINRRNRVWVPGVISPGRPNDYVNLFLEELKVWCRTQLTLDSLRAEELARRDAYLSKVKNDNLYWCFPEEREATGIHRTINYVHDKIKSALEIVSREEKNKSLQTLFRDLNDHTTNTFEFGKNFLGYILCSDREIGANLASNRKFNGRTIEEGKLHRLLEQSTASVFKTYVEDMKQTQDRMQQSLESGLSGATLQQAMNQGVHSRNGVQTITKKEHAVQYIIDISDYEESKLGTIMYTVEICDPQGNQWLVNKTYNDFDNMQKSILADISTSTSPSGAQALLVLQEIFPSKLDSKYFHNKDEVMSMCDKLKAYLIEVFDLLPEMSHTALVAVRAFAEVRQLTIGAKTTLKHAETVPSIFLHMREEFKKQLVLRPNDSKGDKKGKAAATAGKSISSKGSGSNKAGGGGDGSAEQGDDDKDEKVDEEEETCRPMSKNMVTFRQTWGIEYVILVFDAYSLLQRMATILGWTLEINHFFVSMFGNTLTFSQLPLRDILTTQKDIMTRFLTVTTKLFDYACQLNSDQKFKWHKNMQMSENQHNLVRHHTDKAIAIINCIETDHLDYDAQLKRLMDVMARFAPLMARVDGSLMTIQSELNLPVHNTIPHLKPTFDGGRGGGFSFGSTTGGKEHGGSRDIKEIENGTATLAIENGGRGGYDGSWESESAVVLSTPMHTSPMHQGHMGSSSNNNSASDSMAPSSYRDVRQGGPGGPGSAGGGVSGGGSGERAAVGRAGPGPQAPLLIDNRDGKDTESQVCTIC